MTTKSEIGWWVAGAGLVALVVVAAVLAGRPPRTYDLSAPEGTVQAFLQAILDDDTAAARRLLAPDVDERCVDGAPGDESVRITLVSVTATDDTATVEVRVVRSGGEPPFGAYEYTQDATYRLERTDDGWLITSADWPFPCIERIPPP